VAPSGQQASTGPEREKHELADPKRPVHRLPGIWVQKFRYAIFESPEDRPQEVLGSANTSVTPFGQQASKDKPVTELVHKLGDPKPARHRPPTVGVHLLYVTIGSSASAELATDEAERIRKARRDLLWKVIVVL